MRKLPRSLLVKLCLRVLEAMREVTVQNMMGRGVLPIPLICRQKSTQDSVRRKIQPLLFDFVVVVLIVLEVFGYQMKQLSGCFICSQPIFLLKNFKPRYRSKNSGTIKDQTECICIKDKF